MLSEDGNIRDAELAPSVTINGTKHKDKARADALAGFALNKGNGIMTIYKLAKITVRDEEISRMELELSLPSDGSKQLDRLYAEEVREAKTGQNTEDLVYKAGTVGKSIGLSSGTVIFDVPSEATCMGALNDNNAFYLTSLSDMEEDCLLGISGVKNLSGANSPDAEMKFYELDSTRFAKAAVRFYKYTEGSSGIVATPELDQNVIVVESIGDGINEDGEKTLVISGMSGGAATQMHTLAISNEANPWSQFDTLTKTEIEQPTQAGGSGMAEKITDIRAGDIIQTGTNNRGQITNIVLHLRGGDPNGVKWLKTTSNGMQVGRGNQYLGINFGKITALEDGKVVLSELDGKTRVYSLGSPTVTVYTRRTGKAHKGSLQDLEIGGEVYIRQYYSQIREVVYYR